MSTHRRSASRRHAVHTPRTAASVASLVLGAARALFVPSWGRLGRHAGIPVRSGLLAFGLGA